MLWMNPIHLFSWLTSDQGLMLLLTQHWVLATAIIASVIFVETGFVLMPFLPGDSLLFTTGVFLGLSKLDPVVPLMAFVVAACLGDALNFRIGRSRLGAWVLDRQWLRAAHLSQAESYFARYGRWTVIVARFVPIVRTIVPFVAGLAGMSSHRFLFSNILGASAWCGVMLMCGYFLGGIEGVRSNLHAISAMIVLVSIMPLLVHRGVAAWRRRRA